MKILLIGASLLTLGVTSAAAQQQSAPTGAAPDGGVFGTPTPNPATTPRSGPATAQATTPSSAPAQRVTETGGFSIGGLYGYGIDDSDHAAGLNLTFDYGINPGLALQFEQAGFWTFGDGIGGRSVGGLNFNLGDGQGFIPYVGGNIGAIYGNGFDSAWVAGPEIGLKLGLVDAKVAYDMPFDESWDQGNVIATVGLGIRF